MKCILLVGKTDQAASRARIRALAQTRAALIGKVQCIKEVAGLYHLSAAGYTSCYNLAKKIIETARHLSGEKEDWATVRPISNTRYPLLENGLLNTATRKVRMKRTIGIEMPRLMEQLNAHLHELAADQSNSRLAVI